MTSIDIGQLWYDAVLVGNLLSLSTSDDTYYGVLQTAISEKNGDLQKAILDYIQFSMEWNERLREHPEGPPSPDEFDRFGEIVRSGKWLLRRGSSSFPIQDAPVFFVRNEVTLRLRQ